MNLYIFIGLAVFVGVSALVGGVALVLREKPSNRLEDRLGRLTTLASPAKDVARPASVLAEPLDRAPGMLESLLARISNINPGLIFEQAGTSLSVARLVMVCLVLAVAGGGVAALLRAPLALIPLAGLSAGSLPVAWLLLRRRRRLNLFATQLPDALDMLARALRSGQSLASCFGMIAGEIAAPLGKEFGRVFEEQNLGVSLEESLVALSDRVPNLDLKFFATSVILQRQTGGDLSEILDKIAGLIRERFQIRGQVQALTGEGRLSGVVLLGLPVVLFLAVYKLNPTYVLVLFTDPMGKKMLAVAVFLQLIGALVIRKIVNIRV
jgi:tight adherence protein B